MRRRCRLALVLLIPLLTSSCADHAARLGEHLRQGHGRPHIALMPMDVELRRVSAGGFHQPVASWTKVAERHLAAALAQVAEDRGLKLRLVVPASLQGENIHQTQLLQGAMQRAILHHHFGDARNRLPAKHGQLGWSMGASGRSLR